MAICNRVKRNIALVLTILGCGIIVARILDPIMSHHIDGWGWFDIFAAFVITFLIYDKFVTYNKRVKKGIKFGLIVKK